MQIHCQCFYSAVMANSKLDDLVAEKTSFMKSHVYHCCPGKRICPKTAKLQFVLVTANCFMVLVLIFLF